jgi:L-asparaginase II
VDAIRVTVRRGAVVEAVHRVHVRATDGTAYGDDVYCFLRSSLKPIQAVPLAEAYDDLDEDELAIACASHQAEPAQLAAVRKLLARAGATADDLENGLQPGRPDGKLGHNCSGKHAGMLAACRANDWPLHPYSDLVHPVQQRIAEFVQGDRETAVDGCGVPTFAMRLGEMSDLFLRTPERIRAAMVAHPELIGGQGADDTDLMRVRSGYWAKRGAEGLFCVAGDGVAWTFKVEDGANRALRPAIAHVLGVEQFAEVPVLSSTDEVVGAITLAS